MGFSNLYTKNTANPKEIDFGKVGTIVKNKIPEAAIKAFLAKVPKPLAKPFEFKFEKDMETGKLQIEVKQLGFVYGWVDESFARNKAGMKDVEVEIDGWKTHVAEAGKAVFKQRELAVAWRQRLEALEQQAAANTVNEGLMQEYNTVKAGMEKLVNDATMDHEAVIQFWNGGPKEGVSGLIKKHGLPVDQITGERREADADYKLLQQGLQQYQDQVTAFSKAMAPLKKRVDDLKVRFFAIKNSTQDRATERQELEVAIQKTIGDIQGYTKTDFEGVKAKQWLKDAGEFVGKNGAAWTRLSGNSAEIDKTLVEAQKLIEQMRILGSRPLGEYDAWQKPSVPRGGTMQKFQEMLKMVYGEYVTAHNRLQEALGGYVKALNKQRPKAVESEAKMKKAVQKAMAKADAKAAKKGR